MNCEYFFQMLVAHVYGRRLPLD